MVIVWGATPHVGEVPQYRSLNRYSRRHRFETGCLLYGSSLFATLTYTRPARPTTRRDTVRRKNGTEPHRTLQAKNTSTEEEKST